MIKTGIRRLSLSYSRISLRDICVKLHLDSEEDAEYIVGKAIRDGVIEGRIVHEKGWMECGGQKSGYGPEVSDVFSRRISYCLELHNQSVKVRVYFYGYLLCLSVLLVPSALHAFNTRVGPLRCVVYLHELLHCWSCTSWRRLQATVHHEDYASRGYVLPPSSSDVAEKVAATR